MGEWDRRTPWRQGHILTAVTVANLRLVPEPNPDSLVVVVTHDCDLAQDPGVEPVVEVTPRRDCQWQFHTREESQTPPFGRSRGGHRVLARVDRDCA